MSSMLFKLHFNKRLGYLLFIITGLIMISILLTIPAIKQDLLYHGFIDTEMIFGIPNFMNVISNVPFFIVGVYGLFIMKRNDGITRQYLIFFLGIIGVAIGSSYYHLNPNNNTLVWDRLPMTITFMSLLSITVSEFVNDKTGKLVLVPMLFVGLSSIMYWLYFDDLRLYVLVQFYPIVAILIMLLFFKSKHCNKKAYWALLIAYVLAKLFEHYDTIFFYSLKVISGHSLKHLFSAIGLYILITSFKNNTKDIQLKLINIKTKK